MSYENIIISKLTPAQKDEVIAELIAELKAKDSLLGDTGEAATATADMRPSDFDCLAVTRVSVFPFTQSGTCSRTKGIATVTLNDQLVLRGVRIVENGNELSVEMPPDPFFKGEGIRSIVAPVTRQLREHIENCVLEMYRHQKEI